ncbi:MAG: hypothetical protein JW932_02070 [Deltaproteobacteria bacterium]|nr:hypothetical protein [Deltaproteobacteria bacterium]
MKIPSIRAVGFSLDPLSMREKAGERRTKQHCSLELHMIYRVFVDKDAKNVGDNSIIDESGEDYLYPSSYFITIKIPQTIEESLLRAYSLKYLFRTSTLKELPFFCVADALMPYAF